MIITTQKRTRRPISSHFDLASWVNKGFILSPEIYLLLAGPRRKISKGKICTSFMLEPWCPVAGRASFACFVKAIQILICVANVSTQNIKCCRKASKVFHVFNASGAFF